MWNPFKKKPVDPPAVALPPAQPSPGGVIVQSVGHASRSRKRAGPSMEDVMSASVLAVTAGGRSDKASFDKAMAKARTDLKAARQLADQKGQTVIMSVGAQNFSVPPG